MGQAVLKTQGGTIETMFLTARPASCAVSLYTGDGALKVTAGTAVVDTVSTTVSVAATALGTSVTLASVTGIVSGRRYLIGAITSTETREVVQVKSLAGSVATLWGPLHYGHALGAAFGGVRCSYVVASTQADALWWDGYADFAPDTGDVQTETVDCVLRKIPEHLIDETDLVGIFPEDQKILSAKDNISGGLKKARDEFLRRLGGKNRANCALGVDHFRRPCALLFWLLRRHQLGDQWCAVMDGIQAEFDMLLQKIESQIPFDNDQDGTTTSQSDGGLTVIGLERA